jgi:hypothetical protein
MYLLLYDTTRRRMLQSADCRAIDTHRMAAIAAAAAENRWAAALQ